MFKVPTVLFALLPLPLRQEDNAHVPAAEITRAALEHHVAILASDEFLGRGAGTEGAARAADYLVRTLLAAGIEPAVIPEGEARQATVRDPASFRQVIHARRLQHRMLPRLILTTRAGEEFIAEFGVDFTLKTVGLLQSTERLEILRISGADQVPTEPQPDRALLCRMRLSERKVQLKEAGALEAGWWGLELAPFEQDKGFGKQARPAPRLTFQPLVEDRHDLVKLHGKVARDMVWMGFTHAQLEADHVAEEVELHNVVGILRGSDPELAHEVILVETPYDHRGVTTTLEGDKLHPGANPASSVAALLELAEAFAQGERPARTLVFLFDVGKENHRVVMSHYLEHPVVPLKQTVAALLVGPMGIPDARHGAGQLVVSSLGAASIEQACGERGIPVAAGARGMGPAEKQFRAAGVACLSLGTKYRGSSRDRSRDDPSALDYEHLHTVTRALYDVICLYTNGELRPEVPTEGRGNSGTARRRNKR